MADPEKAAVGERQLKDSATSPQSGYVEQSHKHERVLRHHI